MLKLVLRIIKWLIIIFALIWLLFWLYAKYQTNETKKTISAMAEENLVKAEQPSLQDIVVTSDYIGQVEAINTVDIVPYINGYITDICVSGGEKVKKGTVLLTIKQDEYKTALQGAYADILSARADLANTHSQYIRMKRAGKRAVSETELENAKTAYLMSMANLKQAEAAYETAQINYSYTYIQAPFDGILGNISASVGDYVSSNSEKLLTLVQYNPIRIVFSVTDKEYIEQRIKGNSFIGKKISLSLPNGAIYDKVGEIKYTANEIDNNTNSVALYAEISNPQQQLLPNGYVKVLINNSYKNVVLINKELILLKNDGNYAYTIDDGILKLSKINILADSGEKYVLANTFKTGQLLVTEEVNPQMLGKKVGIKSQAVEK